MRCPRLDELPEPPEGRSGWPWTEQTPPAAGPMPRISIVVPSLNRADMIEETLRSILLQGYPDLQLIVIDGGSTDGTVELLEQYDPHLTGWVSEPDEGQSQAINKGMRQATGEVLAYINTDDLYTPGALVHVGELFADPDVHWVSGPGELFGPGVGKPYRWPRRAWTERWQWLIGNCLTQSSTFWRRTVIEQAGLFDEDMHRSMDYEYWLRIVANGFELTWTDKVLSRFRIHSGSITGEPAGEFPTEEDEMRERYLEILSEEERRKAQRARRQWVARKYRWRGWRRALDGLAWNALGDFWRTVCIAPELLLSPKTLAVPVVALARLVLPAGKKGEP
ncbi:MAG: glycosyltransferase family 2 protein [Candidatus Brocadiia bacterium]